MYNIFFQGQLYKKHMKSAISHRKIQQFIVVAEELSFLRAAQRLHMTQPPLSMAIQSLEEEIGTALFQRNRRVVRLTPAGSAFLQEARRALNQVDTAVQSAREVAAGDSGHLRLSFVPSAGTEFLPSILRHFRTDYPRVRLSLASSSSLSQMNALRRHDVDLCVIVSPLHDVADMKIQLLSRESMMLALPSAHPLASMKRVEVRDLVSESFVTFDAIEGPGFIMSLLEACRNAGFFPHIVRESGQLHTILTMVACAMGIAFVPRAAARIMMEGVTYLDVQHEGAPIFYEMSFLMRASERNPVVHRFIELSLQHVMAHAHNDTDRLG